MQDLILDFLERPMRHPGRMNQKSNIHNKEIGGCMHDR